MPSQCGWCVRCMQSAEDMEIEKATRDKTMVGDCVDIVERCGGGFQRLSSAHWCGQYLTLFWLIKIKSFLGSSD